MGLAVDMIKISYGDNTKWKWSFVDLDGRFAAIVKNLLDFRKAQGNDMNNPEYPVIANHIKLAKQLMSKCADRFVERYELSTKRKDDLKNAVNFISALHRVKSMLFDREDMDTIKKKIDVWQGMLDGIIKPLV